MTLVHAEAARNIKNAVYKNNFKICTSFILKLKYYKELFILIQEKSMLEFFRTHQKTIILIIMISFFVWTFGAMLIPFFMS